MIGGAVWAVAQRFGYVVAPREFELHQEPMHGFFQRGSILAMHRVNSTLSLSALSDAPVDAAKCERQ